MKAIRLKLKDKLIMVNLLVKLAIMAVIVLVVPTVAIKFSINQTDENLIRKLDNTLAMIDSMGIEAFLTEEDQAFGSYNILKEEYVSLEKMEADTLLNYIGFSERIVDNSIVDYRTLSYSTEIDNNYYLIEIGESLETIFALERQLRRYALIFMLMLIVVTIVLEFFSITTLLRPLDRIVANIKSSRSPSSFNYDKVPTSTTDFEYLQETIHSQMRRIEKAFNSEREYISDVSHELLTPISVIQSKLESMISEGNLPESELPRVFEARKMLGRLTVMVRTLLTLSRIENDEYPLKERVDIGEIVENVLEELSDRLEAKVLSLKVDWKAPATKISGNRQLLFNMFYNLVNNAIKFTVKGGITVTAEEKEDKTVVTIGDTGKGIQADRLEGLFTRFVAHDTDGGGYGLGLALVKKICDYHSILISVESAPGMGTKLFLEIKREE